MNLAIEQSELASLTGQAIVNRFIEEVRAASKIEDKRERFLRLNDLTKLSGALSDGFKLSRAASLVLIAEIWDDIPLEERIPYNLQFRLYAEKVCPDLTWTTIQNHMRAAGTFLLQHIAPQVPITIEGKTVEFNPLEIPISKLVLARSAAESGKIDQNPKLWEIIVDPKQDVAALRRELFSEESKEVGIDPSLIFELVGPFLIAKQDGDETIVCQFDFEEYFKNNPVARAAIDRVMRVLGVQPDETIILAVLQKQKEQREKAQERRIT